MLAVSASLQEGNIWADNVNGDTITLCDAALKAFDHMT